MNERHILVLDDEESIVEFLGEVLEDEGHTVRGATTVAEASELWKTEEFDVAVFDKNLPDGSGVDLAGRMASEGRDCKFVLITGYPNVESAVVAMQNGVSEYFAKPLDLDDLLVRFGRMIELQESQREHRRAIDKLRREHEQLSIDNVRDSLTGLYNRGYMEDFVRKELARSSRFDLEASLVFIDVDHFKKANDTLGHLVGDRILATFADVLLGRNQHQNANCRMRAQDVPTRFGGDEFAIILPETSKTGAAIKAERLREYVDTMDFGIEGLDQLSLSVGVATFPHDGSDRDSLLAAADRAVYAAKRGGRNRVVACSPELADDGEQSAELEATRREALGRSISERLFDFDYQPVVDAENWTVFAYEAFARPTDPTFPGPREVLAAARNTGRLGALGRLLRAKAIEPLESLEDGSAIFVNVHPQELNDSNLLLEASTLGRASANRVVLEITGASTIKHLFQVRDTIARLRAHGYQVCVEDLADGYIGLDAVTVLQPQFVRVDAAMIEAAMSDSRQRRTLKHLSELCSDLGAKLVAKRVETTAQMKEASALGIHLMQGYLFAPPAPPFARFKRPSAEEQ